MRFMLCILCSVALFCGMAGGAVHAEGKVMEQDSLQELFALMIAKMDSDPKGINNLEATYQYNLDSRIFRMTFKKTSASYAEEKASNPHATFIMSESDFRDMVSGKLSGWDAYMSGKLVLKGSITYARKLEKVFNYYQENK